MGPHTSILTSEPCECACSAREAVHRGADSIAALSSAALLPRRSARFFATPVNLFEKIAHHADQRRSERREKQNQRHCAPKCAVGRQSGLETRRRKSHAARDERKKTESGGKNVEVPRHGRRRGVKHCGLLRFYGPKSQPESSDESITETPAPASCVSIAAAEPSRSIARHASRKTTAGNSSLRASSAE